MKYLIAVLTLTLALCCVEGSAQTVAPSITIGVHVLKLGMDENTVLAELKEGFQLQQISNSDWMISKKVGEYYHMAGEVSFTGHKLTTAIRDWDNGESSSKSLFYALNQATHDLELEGLTECQISTSTQSHLEDSPDGSGSGSIHKQEIMIDCGVKQVVITMFLSDVPDVNPTNIHVQERLRRR
jgi:hypothetical protein